MKPTYKKSPAKTTNSAARQNQKGGSFGRGLMGGLLGGALGGLLFGSMFGAGGTGMGILPILLLAGGAYFLFKRFSAGRRGQSTAGGFPGGGPSQQGFQREGQQTVTPDVFGGGKHTQDSFSDSSTPEIGGNLLEEGVYQIRQYDRDFDPKHFTEVASDVFFQVQAGWMRRDLDSYRHLLGEQLAGEYADHFEEMKAKGIINKLESIAIRGVDIVQAGSDGSEDFVTVKFTASLLDYNVDD
ncbi:MAG: preprotein translocase subunit Tim44, partial [Desulfobacterales bacterium]